MKTVTHLSAGVFLFDKLLYELLDHSAEPKRDRARRRAIVAALVDAICNNPNAPEEEICAAALALGWLNGTLTCNRGVWSKTNVT